MFPDLAMALESKSRLSHTREAVTSQISLARERDFQVLSQPPHSPFSSLSFPLSKPCQTIALPESTLLCSPTLSGGMFVLPVKFSRQALSNECQGQRTLKNKTHLQVTEDAAILEASDGGKVEVKILGVCFCTPIPYDLLLTSKQSQASSLSTPYVELVAQVIEPGSVKMLNCIALGETLGQKFAFDSTINTLITFPT